MNETGGCQTGPLAGVKVLDFSGFIAGCYAAQLLGDLGAQITKVEPLAGDGARYWGPFIGGESRAFQGWNRNKRSIALDLRSEAGLEVIYDLVRGCDVVVENFRPGVTKKLKIKYDTLRVLNPQIVYLSISGFGDKGPHGERPGYDPVLQSMSGTARANERFSGKVSISSVAVSDYGAGMLGSNGVLAALFHREKTGEGQHIQTSLLQAVMAIQSHSFVQALEVEEEPPAGIFPYRLFETKDDLIFICAPTDKFWQLLCVALGAPELASDPKYKSNPDRVARAEELAPVLEPLFRKKTTALWEAQLLDAGVPCGAVGDYQEFFENPQVTAMDMNPVVEHPAIGPIRLAGVPLHFSKTPGAIQSAAPKLGAHTVEILEELGMGPSKIQALKDDGVI